MDKVSTELDDFGFSLKAISVDFFHLANIKEVQKRFNTRLLDRPLEVRSETQVSSGCFLENNIFQNQVVTKYLTFVEQEQIILGEFIIAIDYIIKDLEKYKDKDDKIILPSALGGSLISISISTTRGILFEKLANTFLSNVIMPLIDPSKFIITELPKSLVNKKKKK